MTRILLLEDNHDMREAIKEALTIFDFEVIVGRDGNDGLAAIEEQHTRPDLIITDLRMPNLSGEELLDYLRQNPELDHIGVIIMSGSSANLDTILERGADAFIVKPFNFNDLFKMITEVLEKLGH
jgi:DNA-binding response OmpR family regulator